MTYRLCLILAVVTCTLGLLSASCGEATAAGSGLLPTAALARQVQALQVGLGVSEEDVDARVLKGEAVRSQIDQFIIHQLEATPSITGGQLQHQLQSILCTPRGTDLCETDRLGRVFTEGWGPKTEHRQVVVAYELDLGFYGDRSSIVSIESYVWERQKRKARLTARGGGEFDGRDVTFAQLTWYPSANQYWIFVSGAPRGWSGRAYAGRATLYSVGTDIVHTLWTSGIKPNLRVQINELGWEVSYADEARFYNDLPKPYLFDVYKFDYDSREFERVIRYSY